MSRKVQTLFEDLNVCIKLLPKFLSGLILTYTEVFGLKNILRVGTSILQYLGCRGKVDVEFQNKVKTLIHIITENRNRRASGPVHSITIDSVT